MKKSRQRILDRLDLALEDGHAVRIERDVLDDGDLYGIVLGLSPRWVAIQQLNDRVYPDGLAFFRVKHVTKVRKDRDSDYVLRALAALDHEPQPVDLPAEARTRDVLRLASERGPVLSFYDEREGESAMWVGRLGKQDDKTFALRFIGTDGRWDAGTDRFPYSAATLIETGTRYLEGIARFGDPAPPDA
jgi:hypothetical protein